MYIQIDRILALWVIGKLRSAWPSAVILVVKNGKVRLCVKDSLPLGKSIISRRQGILQVQTSWICSDKLHLTKCPKDKTIFTVPGRSLYQLVINPFKFCNTPQTMPQLIDKVITAYLRHQVLVYLHNLLASSSETFTLHLMLLSEVANHMRWTNLTLNVQKNKIFLKYFLILAHLFSS